MSKKIRISFFVPESLKRDINEQMIKDGYDLKGKSRWIEEAIKRLFSIENYPELVKLDEEMTGFEKLDSVSVTKDIKSLLDDSILNIRSQYPTIEGVQSRILRTAIVQRLLRG